MKAKAKIDPINRNALFISITFLFVFVFIELVYILVLNSWHFTYTLDDPYIHLALAEKLIHGHYGIDSASIFL